MIRFLFRLLSTASLATAMIFAVIDAARSVAAGHLVTTPLGQSWLDAAPASLDAVKTFAEERLWTPLWDPGMVTILLAPGFAVFLALALLFYLVGHRPAPRRGRLVIET